MAFGLPIAVAAGWTLAGPAKRPSAASLPSGAGGIGAAPERTGPDEPITDVPYRARPDRKPSPVASGAPLPSLAAVSAAPSVTPSAGPAPTGSTEGTPLPELTAPPVPTPTEVTSEPSPPAPPSASPSTSEEPSAQP
ncbi:hypothetical protein HH310_02975 [Actinoplanes sp. TBRC 11911]|uniref:hypothetical protein n=1 Tax=Actinoplanes sp. TBRC 11911 TaxID=2729386 RepID=UPI00145EBDA8|nr:hypothetical protein [Actinoplanes sp. TBRC 11911]NMO50154.1 hypothetical protein [Actinoplanes sp. TBRC 11911]